MKKVVITLLCFVLVVATGLGFYKFVYPSMAKRFASTDPTVIESLENYTYQEETSTPQPQSENESSESMSASTTVSQTTTKKVMADLVIDYSAKETPEKDTMQTEQTTQTTQATSTQAQTTKAVMQTQPTQSITTNVTEVSSIHSMPNTTPPYSPNVPNNETQTGTPAYENVTTVADLPYTPRMIIIGDKQVRYLSDSVGDNVKDEAMFIYNDGADLQWLSRSGRNRITNSLKEGDIIFLWLGISDFLDLDDNEQAKRYVTFVSDMQKSDWKDHKVVFLEIPYQSDLDNRIVDTDVVNTNPVGFLSLDNLSSYNSYLSELVRNERDIFYMSTNDIIGIETDGTTIDGSSTFRDSRTGIYFSEGIYQDIYIEMYNQFKSLGGVK